MKNFNPIKKLTSGLISLVFGSFMIYMVGEQGVSHCEKIVFTFFNSSGKKEASTSLFCPVCLFPFKKEE